MPHTTETRRAAFDLEARALEDNRRVSLSVSSETPVRRDFIPGLDGPGWEVLGHGPGEVDLTGLEAGRAPFLLDHKRDLESQIGVIERVSIENGRGRAVVRFAKTPKADEFLARIADGEVNHVSVGYSIEAVEPRGGLDGLPLVRVTRWTPREISLVAIAADSTVGIGRSAAGGGQSQTQTRMEPMENQQNGAAAPNTAGATRETGANQARAQERARIVEIQAMAREFELPHDMVRDWIEDGTTVDAARAATLRHMRANDGDDLYQRATLQALGAPALHRPSERSFSLTRAANAVISGDWSDAGYEREVTQELRRSAGRAPSGVFVPTAALAGTRALTTTTTAPGLIGTQHADDMFIDALRPQSVVMTLGAQSMAGLRENVSIPKMTGGTVAEWVAEGVAPAESDPGFGSVTLSARQLSGSVRVSRKQLRQSLPGIDVLLQNDLRAQFAVTLDRTAIAGAGGLEPFGILNAAGVDVRQVADLGTAGAGLLEFRDLTAMMARVLGKDVPMVSPGFLSSWEVRGRLMSTPRFSQANGVEGPPALQEPVTASGPGVGAETIGGFPARFSSTVPRDLGAGNDRHALIFGDWSQLVVATWGALDLIIDDASEAAAGNVRIAAHLFADIAIRHTEAFAVLDNIDPAATGA